MALGVRRVKIPHRVRAVEGPVVRRSKLVIYPDGGFLSTAVWPTLDAPNSETVEQPIYSLQDGTFPGYVQPGRYTVQIDDQPGVTWDAPAYGMDWRTPSLSGAWVPYGAGYAAPQYGRDAYKIVRLRGAAKSGAVGSTIFNLPVGWRPVNPSGNPYTFVVYTATGAGTVTISDNGNVVAPSSPALSNAMIPLDGISFKAEA